MESPQFDLNCLTCGARNTKEAYYCIECSGLMSAGRQTTLLNESNLQQIQHSTLPTTTLRPSGIRIVAWQYPNVLAISGQIPLVNWNSLTNSRRADD